MRHLKLAAWIVAAAAVLGLPQASAQSYPDKTVRITVAFGAGGTLDTLARIVSAKLSEMWGQQVVVENRPGAGGPPGRLGSWLKDEIVKWAAIADKANLAKR